MNVFDLFAKISLDKSEYENGLNEAEGEASSFGSKIGSALATGAKVVGAGLAVTTSAVGKLVSDATSAYADYEQLTGGVETLFKESADIVMQYANNAYKTSGLSANEYMETVTSFSASLLQSLDNDTESAAKKAEMAIVDMADNANKMGTAMESIQNAYNGFAKQNFTMLDNLKLGYGGTKEEMQRLLEDATELSGVEYDIESYADIVDAIHIIQTEMGITGTTALEASETISGSAASLKSAWQNLVTGLGDENANLEELIGNVVDAAATSLDNLLPVVERILVKIGEAIPKIVPIIADILPGVINDILPSLLSAGVTVFNAIVQALPTLLLILIEQAPTIINNLVDAILDNLPAIIECAFKLIIALAEGLIKAIPKLVEKIPDIIAAIVNGLKEGLKAIAEIGGNLIEGLWNGINDKVSWIKDKIAGFGETILNSIKGIFGIHSPSRVFRDEIGAMLALGLGEGWDNEIGDVKKAIEKDMNFEAPSITTSALGEALNSINLNTGNKQQITLENHVVLEGDIEGLFTAIREEDHRFAKATGQSAFAY